MSQRIIVCCISLLALTFLVSDTSAAERKREKGFVTVFDGKTLKGWEATPKGTEAAWTSQGQKQRAQNSAKKKIKCPW